jgi:putative toxin-antitoxin system antitoxin component (TIGR02293 family)
MQPATENKPKALRGTFPELGKDIESLVEAIKKGFPVQRFDVLRQWLDLSAGDAAELLNIPSSTLARRKKAGRLDRDESERTYRIAHLMHRAVNVFGSAEHARRWLKAPQYALGGVTPLAFADTEPGAREVEALLGRIEHGMPV